MHPASGYRMILFHLACGEAGFGNAVFYFRFNPPTKGEGNRGFWQRWQPAWKIKFSAGATRINFDIHRAFGLWAWGMLFILAWSSVAFNLEEVYNPVMNTLFGAPPESEQQAVATSPLPASPR